MGNHPKIRWEDQVSNLEFDQVVRRSGILSVTSPALWAWLDVSASWVAIGERSRAVQLCLDGFTNWLSELHCWALFLRTNMEVE